MSLLCRDHFIQMDAIFVLFKLLLLITPSQAMSWEFSLPTVFTGTGHCKGIGYFLKEHVLLTKLFSVPYVTF